MGLMKSMLLMLVMAPVIMTGCGITKGVEMGDNVITESRIPLIDMEIPELTETATFAMG